MKGKERKGKSEEYIKKDEVENMCNEPSIN